LSIAEQRAVGFIPAWSLAFLQIAHFVPTTKKTSMEGVVRLFQDNVERVQKGIAHWDKQNYAVPAPNCVLKVQGEIIKDEGL